MTFFLISHNRPELCQRALDSIDSTGFSSQGKLVVNGSDYPLMKLPDGWERIDLPKNLGYCQGMNWCFKQFPNEKFYGMMGDDEVVTSHGWDKKLIEAAGDWHISHSNDGVQSHRRIHGYAAFGGELIRTIGYIAPQGMWHWYIDNVWECIAGALGLKRMVEDVRTEHRHYLYGQAPKDKTYELGESRAEQDRAIFERWHQREFNDTVLRVRKAMGDKVIYG